MIEYDILGEIGRDNCVAARVRTGTTLDHLFLDSGGNCLHSVPWTDIRDCTAVFYSHFHFDHFAGFDEILRCTWCRDGRPVHIFGPPDTCRIIYHRLQGFLWNNAPGKNGSFRISEFDGRQLKTIRLLTTEKFANIHEEPTRQTDGLIMETDAFRVQAICLDHGVPSIGYLISEPDKLSINKDTMLAMNLKNGPWAGRLKNPEHSDDEIIPIDDQSYRLGQLRQDLIHRVSGDSLGYLTDFRVDDAETRMELVEMFRGVNTLICENNFRDQELDKAKASHHLTSSEVGRLANDIGPNHLVLFHVSDRYVAPEFREQLEQVRVHFADARFPEHWAQEIFADVPPTTDSKINDEATGRNSEQHCP